jgi:hypothetical protein
MYQKEGRQRGTWNNKKADGDFYKMIVSVLVSKPSALLPYLIDVLTVETKFLHITILL